MTDRNSEMQPVDTIERLRTDIDRGRTNDKVPGIDPAAAPLGADEEAAGTPVPRHAIAQAHALEAGRPADVKTPGRRDISHWLFIAAIVAVLAALAFWALR